MSKKDKDLDIEYIKQLIRQAAKENEIHPSKVTLSQIRDQDGALTEWKLREFGGLTGVRKHFPVTTKDLAEIKKQKEAQEYINKLEKKLGEQINLEKQLLEAIDTALSKVSIKKQKVKKLRKSSKKDAAMELMLSDIHFGKKTSTFNLKILNERLSVLSQEFLDDMNQMNNKYQVKTVLLPLIGDIIESYSMHGSESALSCEFNNPKQIQEAIDGIFNYVILPVAKTGVDVHIPAVTGNHDRTEKNRTYNYPGENNVTWVIYNSLKRYCELSGLDNVTFDIPRESYTTYNLFDKHVILYEHLDNISSPTKIVLEKLIMKRQEQTKLRISMLRGGHWHEYLCVDRGRIIINESVCGQDSFAQVKGYASSAGQVINFYVNDDSLPNGFLYSKPVHLG